MCTATPFEQTIFRILLYRNDTTELLMEIIPEGLRLPALTIPAHTRISEQITRGTRRSWNLESYCLFCLPASRPRLPRIHYQVAELCGSSENAPSGMRWARAAAPSVEDFKDREDFEAIQNSQITLDQYRREELPGAFGKPGWLRMVIEWVKEQAAAAGLSLTGQFRQLSAGPAFSLLRFETDGSALWFKAVGEPNQREFPITCALAHLLPAYLPPIAATRADWNAWLAAEVAGTHPDQDSGADTWVAVATTLADLQVASHRNTLPLVEAGCQDTGIHALEQTVDPFLEVVAELMEQQTKLSPTRLSARELLSLGSQLRKILASLGQSAVPNVLSHLDLNPGNILVSGSRCLFLDWAEACIGQPFVAFEYLLEHLRKLRPGNPWEAELTTAYTERWKPFLDTRAIDEALAAAPLLAVFTCAIAGGTWRDLSRRSRPEIAALLRGLTRRIKREADGLEQRRIACAS